MKLLAKSLFYILLSSFLVLGCGNQWTDLLDEKSPAQFTSTLDTSISYQSIRTEIATTQQKTAKTYTQSTEKKRGAKKRRHGIGQFNLPSNHPGIGRVQDGPLQDIPIPLAKEQ